MKISAKTEYALRTVVDLASLGPAGTARTADIADRQGIPVKFLEQILLTLKAAGIVSSKRGSKGGYSLALLPSRITLAAIATATESNLIGGADGFLPDSPFAEVWADIEAYTLQRLERTTIQDMTSRARELAAAKAPHYAI